ncbi:hypothetical protein Tco_1353994 [Tanacetum coccineum]
MDFIQLGWVSRVDEMILARVSSGFAGEKTEAMKEENVKAKNLGRLIKPIFETRSDGIQCFERRIWLPLFGGLRDLIMHECTKSNISFTGVRQDVQRLKKLYWLANMEREIATYVR